MQKSKKIVVGLSGGVDSSMTLVLLKEQGWQPVGVSLKYAVWQDPKNLLRENVCCNAASFAIARQITRELKVPYHILDVSKDFKKEVIDYFIKELKNQRTPNPCVVCNQRLKFKKLFEFAKKNKIQYVATGHYAQIKKNLKTNKYELRKAKDNIKDQTYSLSFLPQSMLRHVVLPLGAYIKNEIYQLAKKKGFKFFLKTKQSQDFCFVSDSCLECFLRKELKVKPGPIKDTHGNFLGEHPGLHFFTIGQRKRLNFPKGPYYVKEKLLRGNILIVTNNQKELYSKSVVLSPINIISGDKFKNKLKISAKSRSHQALAHAILKPIGTNKAKVVFNKPQKALTPGQFTVFYKGRVCFGSGRIIKTF